MLWGGESVAASLVNGQTGKFSEQEVAKSNYQDWRGKKGVLCKYIEVRREEMRDRGGEQILQLQSRNLYKEKTE